MAPAAKVNDNGSSPVICSTAEGDHRPDGLRRAREHRRPELLRAPEARGLHGDGDARALGDVLERDREEHEQARPSVSDANAVPIAKPSGRLCTSSTPKTSSDRRTPAPLGACRRAGRGARGPAADQQEEHARGESRHDLPGVPSSRAGRSNPRPRPRSSARRSGPTGGAASTPPAGRGGTPGTAPSPVASAVPSRRARARPRRSRRRAYFRPRSFPGTA